MALYLINSPTPSNYAGFRGTTGENWGKQAGICQRWVREVIERKKYIVFCDLISAVCYRSLPRDRFEFCLSISRLLSSIENPQPYWNNRSANRIAWAVWKIIKFIFDSTHFGEKDILVKNLYEAPLPVYIKGRIAHELFCTGTKGDSPWGRPVVLMSWTSSEILTRWRDEMQKLCKQVDFFSMFCSGKLFWIYATTNPEEARLVLTSVQPGDSLYDALWKGIANHTYSSSGEVFVHFDVSILSALGDLELHRQNAQKRLRSEPLDDETKYILQAIISGEKISPSDGSVMD